MTNPFTTILASANPAPPGEYAANTAFALNDTIRVEDRNYKVTEAGTTAVAGTAPTHTIGEVLDGTVLWDWAGYELDGGAAAAAGITASATAGTVPTNSDDPSDVDLDTLSSQTSGGSAMTTAIFTTLETEFSEK